MEEYSHLLVLANVQERGCEAIDPNMEPLHIELPEPWVKCHPLKASKFNC